MSPDSTLESYSSLDIVIIIGTSDFLARGSLFINNPSEVTSTTNYSFPSIIGDLICPTVILSKDPSPSSLRVLSNSSCIAAWSSSYYLEVTNTKLSPSKPSKSPPKLALVTNIESASSFV
jgi:hypothetical protein